MARFCGGRSPISTRVDEVLRERQNRRQPFEEMSRAVRLLRKTIADVCNTDRRVCQRKGRATIHTLRDTYASRLDAAGVSILQIRDLLGHADVSTTQKYASGEKRAAVDAAKRAMAAEVVAQN